MASTTVYLVSTQQAIAASAAVPAVSIVIVALRFFSRYWKGARYGADDWLTVPALLLFIGMGAVTIVGEKKGLSRYPLHAGGNDSGTLDPTTLQSYVTTSKTLWTFQILMYPMSAFTKLSILFFYRRVFWPDAYPRLGLATLITSGLVILWSLVFLLLNIFSCGSAVQLNWAPPREHEAHCFGDRRLEQPYAVSDLALNVLLLLLPLSSIHRLQLGFRRRAAVGCIMMLGSGAIAASTVRVVLLASLMKTTTTTVPGNQHDASLDKLHTWCTIVYWSIIEAGLALQTACLPVLCRLLPVKVFGRSSTGRMGSVLTQRGNEMRAAGGRHVGAEDGGVDGMGDTVYGTREMTEGGRGGDPSAAADYPRSSGWFARYRMAPREGGMSAIDAERLSFTRIRGDDMSEISELDLAGDRWRRGNDGVEGDEEEARGRSRTPK